jgi:hypothetical protein
MVPFSNAPVPVNKRLRNTTFQTLKLHNEMKFTYIFHLLSCSSHPYYYFENDYSVVVHVCETYHQQNK